MLLIKCKEYIEVLDLSGATGVTILLDGKGNPLPARAQPVYLRIAFEQRHNACNSRGEPFTQPLTTEDFIDTSQPDERLLPPQISHDEELCQRCGELGDDRRNLWISCLSNLVESAVPFAEHFFANNREGPRRQYMLRICKPCRAGVIAAIEQWYSSPRNSQY